MESRSGSRFPAMTTYRNPRHDPDRPELGPANYTTDVPPTEYRGYLIYHRTGLVWDVVKDGECTTQTAGPNGAKRAIDKLLDA